jgi:hypothetical protein
MGIPSFAITLLNRTKLTYIHMSPILAKEIQINLKDTHPIQVCADMISQIIQTESQTELVNIVNVSFEYLLKNLDSEEQTMVNILFYDEELETDDDKWALKLFILNQFYGLLPDIIGDIVLDLENLYPELEIGSMFLLRKKLGLYASELNEIVFDEIEAEL